MQKIDTSIEGIRYAGINLTEKQYEDLKVLNLQAKCHDDIPVFHMLMVLKALGLLPSEMISEVGNNQSDCDLDNNFDDGFQRKYGKRK